VLWEAFVTAILAAGPAAERRSRYGAKPAPFTASTATEDTRSECGRERTPGALHVEDLLPQDVRVPAVLGEFAQYVEVHPAHRERAAPVAVDGVVQPQG
jgi:hypothetical protein